MAIVRDQEGIKRARGSKYCPVKPTLRVNDLKNARGKIAVVGLPCHI